MIEQLIVQLAGAWRSTSWVELLAAALAVIYLLFAIKQWRACWVAAFVSSCLYAWVLFGARLYMESVLNLFYAAMAVYGYRQWTARTGTTVRISRWSAKHSAGGVTIVIALSVVSSFFLRRFTPAAWPFVDSMVTWASVVATFLVARKIYENWHWWFIIDSVSLCLYFTRGLYLTMLLFAAYLVMIVVGMREWRRDLETVSYAAQHA